MKRRQSDTERAELVQRTEKGAPAPHGAAATTRLVGALPHAGPAVQRKESGAGGVPGALPYQGRSAGGGPAVAVQFDKEGGTTAPPKTETPAPTPTLEKVGRSEIAKFLQKGFETDFKAKGMFHERFVLSVWPCKKQRKAPAKLSIVDSRAALWTTFAAQITALKTDVRGFRARACLKALDAKNREVYWTVGVQLSRRKSSSKNETTYESTLVKNDSAHGYGGGVKLVEPDTYAAFKKLYAAAQGAGFMTAEPELFKICSGYRKVSSQEQLWKNGLAKTKRDNPGISEKDAIRKTRKWVAQPGGSAHHTGHALDLFMGWSLSRANATKMKDKNSALSKKYGKYWEWMKTNAPSFGFLPYDAEPWHWEHWK